MTDIRNSGHGHVVERPDGFIADCGGPDTCAECAIDRAKLNGLTVQQVTGNNYGMLSRHHATEHLTAANLRAYLDRALSDTNAYDNLVPFVERLEQLEGIEKAARAHINAPQGFPSFQSFHELMIALGACKGETSQQRGPT